MVRVKLDAMWLITAGPTREYLDSVRFLSNGSSGTMGYAIASEAANQGQTVLLVSGPVALSCPAGVERVLVASACEMLDACQEALSESSCEVLLGVAAVSDARPRHCVSGKPAKEDLSEVLELVANPDVLATLAGMNRADLCVGFALEDMHEERGGFAGAVERARAKLERKGLQAIVLNELASMEGDRGECWWVERDAEPLALGAADKAALAIRIVDQIQKRLHD